MVKALVVFNGTSQYLEESFEKDKGIVWNSEGTENNTHWNQAEDALYKYAKLSTEGTGFKGAGYVDLGNDNTGYIEWPHENDDTSHKATLEIRYSASDEIKSAQKILLTINGVDQQIILPTTATYKSTWKVFSVDIHLIEGTNTVRITSLDCENVAIDAIKVK